MKPQSRIFDILLAFCWVMIVVTGSLALGSYWSRRPVSSLQPQSSAAPAAPLPPELSEALPDKMCIRDRLQYITPEGVETLIRILAVIPILILFVRAEIGRAHV